ncbi:MAG TPA: tetratricopeptide repeat protein [Gammaproteobacteria bacterium]|nr:tetratricopeptide repeat protein [Gammaproteobacteria bacterium]
MIHVEQAIQEAEQAFSEGRLDEAERSLLAVLEFDDYEPRALRLLGRIAMQQGQSQRAAELFQRALKAREPGSARAPSGPKPTPTLAELYYQQGHTEAAARIYRELLREAEGDSPADSWRRRLRELEGSAAEPPAGLAGAPEEAVERLEAFLQRVEHAREARRLRGFVERLDRRVMR